MVGIWNAYSVRPRRIRSSYSTPTPVAPQSWIDEEEDDRGDEQEHPEPNEPEIHPELRGEPAPDKHLAARVRAVILVNRLCTEPDSSDTDQRQEDRNRSPPRHSR
jgi:hypothetical protein